MTTKRKRQGLPRLSDERFMRSGKERKCWTARKLWTGPGYALYDEKKREFVIEFIVESTAAAGHWVYWVSGTRQRVLNYIRNTTVRSFEIARVNAALDAGQVA